MASRLLASFFCGISQKGRAGIVGRINGGAH